MLREGMEDCAGTVPSGPEGSFAGALTMVTAGRREGATKRVVRGRADDVRCCPSASTSEPHAGGCARSLSVLAGGGSVSGPGATSSEGGMVWSSEEGDSGTNVSASAENGGTDTMSPRSADGGIVSTGKGGSPEEGEFINCARRSFQRPLRWPVSSSSSGHTGSSVSPTGCSSWICSEVFCANANRTSPREIIL